MKTILELDFVEKIYKVMYRKAEQGYEIEVRKKEVEYPVWEIVESGFVDSVTEFKNDVLETIISKLE